MADELPNDASTEGTQQIVILALGGEQYALPIGAVQEIIRYTPPRGIAASDPSVRGIISLRGRTIVVIDLASRLGVTTETTDDTKIVIVEGADSIAGVLVDDVVEVHHVDVSKLEDAPHSDRSEVEGIVRIDDRLIVLLSPAALVDDRVAPADVTDVRAAA